MKPEEAVSSAPSSSGRRVDFHTDNTTGSKPTVASPFTKFCQKLSSPRRKADGRRRRPLPGSPDPEGVTATAAAAARCSVSDHDQLQRIFTYFDGDGDGKISARELQSSMRATGEKLSAEEAQLAVQTLDADGDGFLGLQDFAKLMDEEEAGGDEEETDYVIRRAFGTYEMDGSGYITPMSLRKVLSHLGTSPTIEDCKAMIRKFDLNGNGVLNFNEFNIMMTR